MNWSTWSMFRHTCQCLTIDTWEENSYKVSIYLWTLYLFNVVCTTTYLLNYPLQISNSTLLRQLMHQNKRIVSKLRNITIQNIVGSLWIRMNVKPTLHFFTWRSFLESFNIFISMYYMSKMKWFSKIFAHTDSGPCSSSLHARRCCSSLHQQELKNHL